MKKIYKYQIDCTHQHNAEVELPCFSKIIDFKFQGNVLYLWAIVDPDSPTENIRFEIYGTGWEIEDADELTHLKTVHINGFVWHIFKRN